jgi:hypothetical protein
MDRRSLYDDDIYAWAQQQADALRRLAQTRRDLPNELDLENVAEEIEDVGKSELREVQSFIRLILIHLIKAASLPEGRPLDHWRGEIDVFRLDLIENLTPSMRPKLDLDKIWRVATIKARAELAKESDQIAPDLARESPFSLNDMTGEAFDFDEAVRRIRNP